MRYKRNNAPLSAAMISLALVALLVMSSCGGNDSESSIGTEELGDVGGQIQYAWWGGPERNDRTQAVIDLYHEAQSDVEVNGTTAEFNAYWENASVQAAGGNLPCVPQMQNRTMAEYADRGALLALDELVEEGIIDTSGIPDSVLDSGRGADGNLYMIPYGAAFGALHVNTTMVEETGLELPSEGYDWEWFAEWALDLSEAIDGPTADLLAANDNQLEAWVRSQGEYLYDEDGAVGFSQETVEEFFRYSEGLREEGASLSAERTSELEGVPHEQHPLSLGQQPTMFWPANGLTSAQEALDDAAPGSELRAYIMPTGPGGPGNALWLSGLSIAETCNNVASAADFIDFFVNDEEAALAYASDNGANTHEGNLQILIDSDEIDEYKRQELELYAKLSNLDLPPTTYGQGYSTVFLDALNRYNQEVAFGTLTVEEGAEAFYQEAVSIIGE